MQQDEPADRLQLVEFDDDIESVDWIGWIGLVGGLVGGIAALYTAARYKAIESYRAKLKAEGYEHEVRFARLHERRMDIVSALYEAIIDAERAFNDWTHPVSFAGYPTKAELGEIAAEAGKGLRLQIRKSRIWLDEDLCREADSLEATLSETFVTFTSFNADVPGGKGDYIKAWQEAWESVSKDVPRLREKIERRFREMLGVTSP